MLKINKEEFCKICNETETMAQAAMKLGLHFNTFRKYAKQFGIYKPNMGRPGVHRQCIPLVDINEVLEGKHPHYPTRRVKYQLLKHGIKKSICEVCNNTIWNGLPISLELEHIDGNRHNHKLANLKLICPNCHAQTETYRGKNKSKYKS